jgi:hypothetical protein
MAAPRARRGGAPRITTARAPASQPISTARTDARSTGVTSTRPNITPSTTAHAARRQARPTHGPTAVATAAPTATVIWVAWGFSTNQSSASTGRLTGGDVGSSTIPSTRARIHARPPPTAPAVSARHRLWSSAITPPPTKAVSPSSHVDPSTRVTNHDGSVSSPRRTSRVVSTASSPASHWSSSTARRATAATPSRRMSAGERSATTGALSCISTTAHPRPGGRERSSHPPGETARASRSRTEGVKIAL